MLLLGDAAAHSGSRRVAPRGDPIVVLLLSGGSGGGGSGGGGSLRLGVLLCGMVGMGLMVRLRPVRRRVLILMRKDVLTQHGSSIAVGRKAGGCRGRGVDLSWVGEDGGPEPDLEMRTPGRLAPAPAPTPDSVRACVLTSGINRRPCQAPGPPQHRLQNKEHAHMHSSLARSSTCLADPCVKRLSLPLKPGGQINWLYAHSAQ